jgi:RAC serine/threonine-protein kinase
MADKQGFLTKEGGSFKSWKKRWCVLKDGSLHYSKTKNSQNLGIISLQNAKEIKSVEYKKRKNMLMVTTPERTFYMQADTEKERDSWVKCLCSSRDSFKSSPAAATSSSPAASSSSSGTVSSPKPAAPAQAPAPKEVNMEDFDLMKVIGKGSFGKVLLVKKRDTKKTYAMKILNKKAIIERNELEHTKTEKKILQKLVHPFLVNLYYSFQTPEHVVFVMDYVNGGELFFHLQKDRRFPEDRVKFYVAEIILGLEYLHANGVLYRDLKPENLLLNSEGHICMTDFGISKEGFQSDDDRTATFCGTPEYLAPEILEGSTYGKPVDWWSLGPLMYEMLNGLPPFYSQDIQTMYSKIMTAKLTFPDFFGPDSCDFLSKVLERNPEKRLSEPKMIKQHTFFKTIDWDALSRKEIAPPYVPPVKGEDDYSMIDEMFTSEPVAISPTEGGPISGVNQNDFDGFTFVAQN